MVVPLQPLSNEFLHFPLKKCSREFRSFMQTAKVKEIIHTLQNQRGITFDLHLFLPPGQEHIKQFLNLWPKRLDLAWGLPGEMVTGQIEPCIR